MPEPLPITWARRSIIADPEKRLRVAALQVSTGQPSSRRLLAQQIREEIEIIRKTRVQHDVRAVFFCEGSHAGAQGVREIFAEEAQRAGVFIGFGDDSPLGKSRYSIVGPRGFFWVTVKEEDNGTALINPAPDFAVLGVGIKAQICSDVGENAWLSLRTVESSVYLVLNPSWTSGAMMWRHAAYAGHVLPRAFLGINTTVNEEAGQSAFATYDARGQIIKADYTPLGSEPGVLIADLPIPIA